MISAEAHAAILREVASTAVGDARAAWKKARTTPSETCVREAFRSCVFAARALRQAAGELPHYTGTTIESPPDALRMLEEAKRIDSAASELKHKLVRIVEA